MSSGTADLREGDLVQLTDVKGRHHTLTLAAGATFHSHKGAVAHDDLIGRPEGSVVESTGGMAYLVLRPILEDYVLSMGRGAASGPAAGRGQKQCPPGRGRPRGLAAHNPPSSGGFPQARSRPAKAGQSR